MNATQPFGLKHDSVVRINLPGLAETELRVVGTTDFSLEDHEVTDLLLHGEPERGAPLGPYQQDDKIEIRLRIVRSRSHAQEPELLLLSAESPATFGEAQLGAIAKGAEFTLALQDENRRHTYNPCGDIRSAEQRFQSDQGPAIRQLRYRTYTTQVSSLEVTYTRILLAEEFDGSTLQFWVGFRLDPEVLIV